MNFKTQTNFKHFIIFSVICHCIVLSFFINGKSNHETIVINMDDTLDKTPVLEVNDVTDDLIYKRMQEIKLSEKESLVNSANLKKEKEEFIKIQNVLSKLKKESSSLKKKNKTALNELKNNEKNIKKQEKNINKIKSDTEELNYENKKLGKKNKNLSKTNKNLDKEIELKKKEDELKNKKKKNIHYKGLLKEYVSNISLKFRKNWIIPISAEADGMCTVMIKQDKRGNLIGTDIKDNCPIDPDFVRSIKKAIAASTPLPKPPKDLNFKDVKEITLEFKLNF
jgi:hypothetical protein